MPKESLPNILPDNKIPLIPAEDEVQTPVVPKAADKNADKDVEEDVDEEVDREVDRDENKPVEPFEPVVVIGGVPIPAPADELAPAEGHTVPRAVSQLHAHYDRQPENLLPQQATKDQIPGALAESASDDEQAFSGAAMPSVTPKPKVTPDPLKPDFICVPMVDVVELALNTSAASKPKMLKEALKRPDGDKYLKAAIEEVKAHIENKMWEVVQLPEGKHTIGSQWVFKIKRNADGSIDQYKGRIIAKGYSQREGVDYLETFALTARFGALRTVITLAALEDMELESIDIATAFLNGVINVKVYMEKPEGVEIPGFEGSEWVLKLLKALLLFGALYH